MYEDAHLEAEYEDRYSLEEVDFWDHMADLEDEYNDDVDPYGFDDDETLAPF